jgi:ABC-type transporter Mla subunit MlaD
MEIPMTPHATSSEALQASIVEYRRQYDDLTTQLSQLEASYQQQKEQMVRALNMLSGATAAIEQLVKNVADELACAATKEISDPRPIATTDQNP